METDLLPQAVKGRDAAVRRLPSFSFFLIISILEAVILCQSGDCCWLAGTD